MNDSITDADLTFHERNTNRQNEAEIYAEKWFEKHKYKYTKYGFDEKNNKVGKDIWFELPEFVRSTPDYIVLGKYVVFCEAKGYRKEKKIKESDFIVYKEWHKILPLFIYFRNFDTNEEEIVAFVDIINNIGNYEYSFYPDNNKKYYIL
tara:strand:- start:125 stop:571 length:447 start_codon:yes stop_codon:yes gene_type:complete